MRAIDYELFKYKRRGVFYVLVSYGLLFGFLYYSLQLGHLLWPWILQLHPNRTVLYCLVAVGYNIILLSVFNFLYGLLYYFEIPFFEQYKIGKGPWPWKDPNPSKVQKWWDLYYSTILRVLFNAIFLVPIIQYLSLLLDGGKVLYKMETDELPDLTTYLWQFAFCAFTDDLAFSISHTLLHTPFLMRHVHRVHHEHKITVGLAATYAHPIEYIFGNVIPVATGGLILGS